MTPSEFLLNFKYAFDPRKPALTARLAGAVLRSKLGFAPRLRYVDFAVDFACNMRCEHCFAASLRDDSRRRMEAADYARVARQAMALGAVNFSFQGGEPLVFLDRLEGVLAACSPRKNVISVTTNGSLLDGSNISRLRKAGVNILTVSLDSGIPQEHDAFRGLPGSFDRITGGIEQALAAGLRVTLGTVITHKTVRGEGIRRLAAMAAEMRVLLYLIFPVPAGKWQGDTSMLLDDSDLEYVRGLVASSPYIRTDFQANLYGRGCGAGKEILYLTPYGDVLVCPFLHISFGNIFEDELSVIRARALSVPCLAHYHQRCLASTDPDFMRDRLSLTWKAAKLPLDWKQVFK